MALEGTEPILEAQLLPKKNLYKRWIGATLEEIAIHVHKGELHAYEIYKGPINGIIWCKKGYIHYDSNISYSDPHLYSYDDESCDYFLLEDITRLENQYPEYIGNISPKSLGIDKIDIPTEYKNPVFHKTKNTEITDCLFTSFSSTVLSVPQFAALWCGVEKENLDFVLARAIPAAPTTSRGSIILSSDDYPCLKPRIMFIMEAIEKNEVEACDELGRFRGNDYISWNRMCLRLDKARNWLENSSLPKEELPFFLFPENTRQEKTDEFKTRITELETKLAACREQLKKAQVENPSPNTKTSTATQVRQEKSLADWKDAFKVMVPVILQCQKEGPKPRTTPELEKMCARYNSTLDKSKMAFLRECLKECLGPEHVNTTGGPTIQG